MEPSTRSSRAGKSCRSLRWQLQEARKRTSRGAPPEGGGTHSVGTFDLGGFPPHRGRLIVHTSREIREGYKNATPEEPRTLDEDDESLFTAMSEMATRRAGIPLRGSVALC